MSHILSDFEAAIQEEYKATHPNITIARSDNMQDLIDKHDFILSDLGFIKGYMVATLASLQKWYVAFTSNVQAIKTVLDDIGGDLSFVVIAQHYQWKGDVNDAPIGDLACVMLFAANKENEYEKMLIKLAKLKAFA